MSDGEALEAVARTLSMIVSMVNDIIQKLSVK
jgi:hypothetical protein